jgi:hypothetical protein
VTFFGPGSEWFWAMTQCLVFTVTLLAIYRQLSAQRSANALQQIESLNEQWDGDRMLRTRLQLALHVRHGEGFEAVYPVLTAVCQFFEDLAVLQEKGHIDSQYVWVSWGRTIQFYWTVLKPHIEQGRVVEDDPQGKSGFEALNGLMRQMDMKHGQQPFVPSAEFINRRLDAMITRMTVLARMELDARSGVIPTVSGAQA